MATTDYSTRPLRLQVYKTPAEYKALRLNRTEQCRLDCQRSFLTRQEKTVKKDFRTSRTRVESDLVHRLSVQDPALPLGLLTPSLPSPLAKTSPRLGPSLPRAASALPSSAQSRRHSTWGMSLERAGRSRSAVRRQTLGPTQLPATLPLARSLSRPRVRHSIANTRTHDCEFCDKLSELVNGWQLEGGADALPSIHPDICDHDHYDHHHDGGVGHGAAEGPSSDQAPDGPVVAEGGEGVQVGPQQQQEATALAGSVETADAAVNNDTPQAAPREAATPAEPHATAAQLDQKDEELQHALGTMSATLIATGQLRRRSILLPQPSGVNVTGEQSQEAQAQAAGGGDAAERPQEAGPGLTADCTKDPSPSESGKSEKHVSIVEPHYMTTPSEPGDDISLERRVLEDVAKHARSCPSGGRDSLRRGSILLEALRTGPDVSADLRRRSELLLERPVLEGKVSRFLEQQNDFNRRFPMQRQEVISPETARPDLLSASRARQQAQNMVNRKKADMISEVLEKLGMAPSGGKKMFPPLH